MWAFSILAEPSVTGVCLVAHLIFYYETNLRIEILFLQVSGQD
ncbi:hypothetical protein NIES25_66680 (plasmid) [Nostoc linckia NIES-25]|nr:hypothetical protein NIES25_66680 [Nostoc linckia NIES-25]